MAKPKQSTALTTHDIEQFHARVLHHIKERLAFLVRDYGFYLHPILPFKKATGGGASLVTFAKKCEGTELWIRIHMEYTAVWGIIMWNIQDSTCRSAGIHQIIRKR